MKQTPKIGEVWRYRCPTFSTPTPDGPVLSHDERCGQSVTVTGHRTTMQAQDGRWFQVTPSHYIVFEDGVESEVFGEGLWMDTERRLSSGT